GGHLAQPAVALRAGLLPDRPGPRADRADDPLCAADRGPARRAALALPQQGLADAGRDRRLLLSGLARRDPPPRGRLHGADLLAPRRPAPGALARAQR